ncbi:MAG TPA: methyltransferase [Vicinamibacterales bacterium]|nr:methyltransferase [Vicinamibacterales bacterium]
MQPRDVYTAPVTDDRRLWDLWLSGLQQPSIVAAEEAGIFSSLAAAPATAPELAARLNFDERATTVLVRLLAALRLLVVRDGRYQLTEEARIYLVKGSPWYWAPMASVAVSQWHRDRLLEKLKQHGSDQASGPEGTPLVSAEGRAADDWAAGNVSASRAREVAARMHAHSVPAAVGVARNYGFTGVARLLDVGGGSGCFMVAAAQMHPHLRCTVMELPAMCEAASSYIEAGGVADRVDTCAVDMFRQPWPRGYDALFFSNIWHDWNVRTCRWLAARAFDALPSGGRILLHEMLLDEDGAGPVAAASFSMLMLLATQGQQFTLGELRDILTGAGFTRVDVTATHHYYSVVTGYKA